MRPGNDSETGLIFYDAGRAVQAWGRAALSARWGGSVVYGKGFGN